MDSKKSSVMDEYEKQIEEIDRQLKELGSMEITDLGIIVKEKDQKKEALESIKQVITELNEKEDLKKFKDNNQEEYQDMLSTITSWFNYLKKESKYYFEAKDIIRTFGKKDLKLNDWCEELINDEMFFKEHNTKKVVLNINESDTLIFNDKLKIIVNLDEYKKYIKDYQSFHLRNIFYTYKVITDKEEYIIKKGWKKCKVYKEESKPCPYLISTLESADYIEFSIF